MNANTLYIYDKQSYENALQNPDVIPLQIGVVERNEKGEDVFKTI